MKRILSLALCLILLLGTLSCAAVTVSAAEDADQTAEENQITGSDSKSTEGLSDAEVKRLAESIKSGPTEYAKSELATTSAQSDLASTEGNLDSGDFYAYVSSYLGNLYLSYDEDDYDNVIVESRDNFSRKQLWYFMNITSNLYVIMNQESGQLLELSGGSAANHANIWTNSYTGTVQNKQLWYINAIKVGDKTYYQFNSYVDSGFDIERESDTSSNIELYKDENTTYSCFKIIEIPIVSKAEAVSNGVKLSLESSYNNVRYMLFRQEAPFVNWKRLGITSSYSFVDTTAQPGKEYFYTVRCIDEDGYYLSDYERYGKYIKYQGIPKLLSIFSEYGYMDIFWESQDLNDNQVYRVFRKTGSSGWKLIDETNKRSDYGDGYINYYFDENVSYGTKYTYTVRVYNTVTESYNSYFNTSGVSLKNYNKYFTVTPKLKSVENTTSGVKLTWGGAVYDIGEYYRIFRKTSGGSWKKLTDVKGKNGARYVNRTYTDKTAKSGTKYYYTVRVVYESKYVSSYDATGKGITYVAAPKLTNVYNTSSGVRLNWGKVTGAGKYRVFRRVYNASTGKWSGWSKVGDTSNTYGVDTAVKRNTKYRYTVRCMNKTATAYTSAYDTTGTVITFK